MACAPFPCPFPLVVPDDVANAELLGGTCCALPCRGSMHSPEEWDRFRMTQLIVSAVGLVLTGFMFLTWGLFEKKKKQYMTFWMSLCSGNISLAFLVMAILAKDDLENVLCKDNSQPVTMKDDGHTMSPCVFQAAWVVFFGGALVGWWTVQSIDLFRKLYLGARNTDGDKMKYHAAVWAFPTGSTAYLLITKQLGYNQPTPYCFVNGDANVITEWASFYGYIAGCLIVGVCLMFVVFGVIVKHANRQASVGAGSSAQRYKMYRTPLLFVLAFVFVWANIFAFRLMTSFNEDDYKAQGEAWVTCLLGNALSSPHPDGPAYGALDNSMLIDPPDDVGDGCGVTQGGIPDASLFLTFVVIMSQSILLWVVFGTMNENYALWGNKLGCTSKQVGHGLTDYEASKNSYNTGQPSYAGNGGNGSYYGSQQEATMPYGNGPPPQLGYGQGGGGYGAPPGQPSYGSQYGSQQGSQYGGNGGGSQFSSYSSTGPPPPGSGYPGAGGGGYGQQYPGRVSLDV